MFLQLQIWHSKIARFLTAQTISLLGSSVVQYAIIWYITLNTSSGKMLMIATLCGFLPQIGISLFAGVWIDRYDRKKLIMLADSVIALSTLALALAFLFGCKDIWLVFAVLIVRSAGTGIQTPAVNAIIPQLVPPEKLMKINGINSTLSSVIMFLSPALSGAVLAVMSLEATLLIDVITAAIGVGITATIKIPPLMREVQAGETCLHQLKAGFAYLRNHPFVKRLLLFQMTVLFLISPSAFLTPLMVSRSFGPQIWRLTISEMAYSLGMILGGVLITVWGGFSERIKTVLAAAIFYGFIMIGLGLAPLFVVYLVLNTLIGIAAPLYNAPLTVLVQEQVPPAMHGRIFSLLQIASSCALPLGMVLFGPLADRVSVQSLLLGSGSVVVLLALYLGFSKKLSPQI